MDKVSHIQFVENLASKLGLTEEETVKKLTELILTINKEAAGGEIVIDGLGTFTTKNKKLTFVPDESFELELNHNYAGMTPVLIDEPGSVPAAAAKKADDEAEPVDDSVSGIDAGDDADDFEEEEFVDVIDEQDPFDLDDEDDAVSGKEAAATRSGEAGGSEAVNEDAAEKVRKAALEAEEKKIKEEEAAAQKEAMNIQPNWVEQGAETTPEPEAATESKETKPVKKEIPAYDRARPDSNTGTIIAILVAAIVVVAGALYLFGFLSGSPSDTITPVVSEQTDIPPAVTDEPEAGESDAAISEMEQLAEQEAARDITAQPDAPAEEEALPPPAELQVTGETENTPATASFGLRGTMDTSLERPYTIVVHSLASRTDAEREAADLAGDGYRSAYFRVELPNGSVRWRVAIGQFRSSNAAVDAATQLPDPYLTNHFISRIESYNP